MNTDTTITPKLDSGSNIFGISVRAWLAIMIIGSFCLVCLVRATISIVQLLRGEPTTVDIPQELNGLALTVTGFYLGQKYQESSAQK